MSQKAKVLSLLEYSFSTPLWEVIFLPAYQLYLLLGFPEAYD
jgi:hypothetical protein